MRKYFMGNEISSGNDCFGKVLGDKLKEKKVHLSDEK